jgi:predicted  nucleic acid-binding Zn-ribbon protein
MLWALRGRARSLKPEVRAWITEVELEFSIGPERYCVSFTDFNSVPRGKLVMLVPGPASTLDTFDGDEAFEKVVGDLMMKRFALQPIPNVSHGGDETTQYVHSWTAYAGSMFIEGSHPAILGDVTVGALWWRMLHLFVGMPYAGTHMALRNAITLEQAQRETTSAGRAAQSSYAAETKRLEGEAKRLERELKNLGDSTISIRELDALTLEHATLAREVSGLQTQISSAESAAGILRAQRDEAKAVLRRLQEGEASRKVFAGLNPVCCPRCASGFPQSRAENEEVAGRCAVCDRQTLGDDEEALREALEEARERVGGLTQAERAARSEVDRTNKELSTAEARRSASASKILEIERQEDRTAILKIAEAIAESRMKAASVELFGQLETEVVAVAKRFGFRGLESMTIRGNGINLTVSGVTSSYSKQTAGQRLRLRIALVIAMMRLAYESGFGHHPGLLFIDSPGSEELSEGDLLAMLTELGQVALETPNLQVFVASARGDLLTPAFDADNLKHPGSTGTIF